jgi:hypothetical protein
VRVYVVKERSTPTLKAVSRIDSTPSQTIGPNALTWLRELT